MIPWTKFEPAILPHLTEDDDSELWSTALNFIFREATFLSRCAGNSTLITASVGCCSHWLRPHQTRWTADGGFAWPSGYSGADSSRHGRPEHDWEEEFFWCSEMQGWICSEPEIQNLEYLNFRVTLPARTARHMQAAVSAVWKPGTPVLPDQPVFQMYGFRQQSDQWNCTATNESGVEHYELAANHPGNKTR